MTWLCLSGRKCASGVRRGFGVDGERRKLKSRLSRGEIYEAPESLGDTLGMSVNVIAGSKIENGDPA
jgi:hypothetical protein